MPESTTKSKTLTPMMEQYYEFRNKLSNDTLLLFRLGDFYEMFDDDAEVGSRILGITLTKRHETPMAGIPYHASETYIDKVLKAGKKVAICEQVETPQTGKLVKRALTRILSPGTTLQANQLTENQNNYILSLDINKKGIHCAWMDISTGEFKIATDPSIENLMPILFSLNAKELLIPHTQNKWQELIQDPSIMDMLNTLKTQTIHTHLEPYYFDTTKAFSLITETLNVHSLDGFGINSQNPALGSAAALIHYVTENLCSKPQNLQKITEYQSKESLLMDPSTIRNLEIFQSSNYTKTGSLIHTIDHTLTAQGARLLEHYLMTPTLNLDEIKRRQDIVEFFYESPITSDDLRISLAKTRDIPRILSRIQNRITNPRELNGIKETLLQLPSIKQILIESAPSNQVQELIDHISDFSALESLLSCALEDELPNNLQDGGFIKPSFNTELEHLKSLTKNNKTWIIQQEAQEQAKTGIKNLKIKFNNAFGYFIEVTKSNLHLVPSHYIRKQTMTNAERFYTQELKEKEKEILSAEENALLKEIEIFNSLIQEILKFSPYLKTTSEILAQLDLFTAWAKLAREENYCKPLVNNSYTLNIQKGRHPVVEKTLQNNHSANSRFVPNDTELSSQDKQIALITGPNMAGKSTYIRQVALITLMAQIGSWVPAESCQVGLVDHIFSRVGASDELSRGNSTFMVEMNETANILNNSTPRSLIILDEIGRGTSTYDGLSIAWSVIEFIHGEKDKGARTLFATHYHELTQLEANLPRLENYSVLVKEWNDQIIFVRQIVKGPANKSYGIEVARLAGLPQSVIKRAQHILETLDSSSSSKNTKQTKNKQDIVTIQNITQPSSNTKNALSQLEFELV